MLGGRYGFASEPISTNAAGRWYGVALNVSVLIFLATLMSLHRRDYQKFRFGVSWRSCWWFAFYPYCCFFPVPLFQYPWGGVGCVVFDVYVVVSLLFLLTFFVPRCITLDAMVKFCSPVFRFERLSVSLVGLFVWDISGSSFATCPLIFSFLSV